MRVVIYPLTEMIAKVKTPTRDMNRARVKRMNGYNTTLHTSVHCALLVYFLKIPVIVAAVLKVYQHQLIRRIRISAIQHQYVP